MMVCKVEELLEILVGQTAAAIIVPGVQKLQELLQHAPSGGFVNHHLHR